MGWSGAMAGLGKGMKSYAGTMRDQQKMEWKSQQESIAHERQLNLEKLRASNQRTLAKDQRGWAEEESLKQREWGTEEREGREAATSGALTEARGYTEGKEQEARDRLPAEQEALRESKVLDAQAGFSEKQRQESVAQDQEMERLHKTPMYKKADPAVQEYMDMSIVLGAPFVNNMSKLTKKAKMEPPTAAMISQVAETFADDKVYKGLDAYSKWMLLTARATRSMNPQLQGNLKTVRPDQLDKVAQDLADGKTGPHDLAVLDPQSAMLVVQRAVELGETPSTTKKVLTSIGSALKPEGQPVQRSTMMSPPTGPESSGPSLGSMFYDKLGGALQSLRNKK